MSAMTDFYIKNAPLRRKFNISFRNRKIEQNSFKMCNYINADYVILPGMVGTEEYLKAPSKKMVDILISKGCKVIFLGLGCNKYDIKESDALKRYYDQIKPALITTRDNETYERFKNVAPCIKAIDCAFWGIDFFDPRGFSDVCYDVITFNRIPEPIELRSLQENVVRPCHMQYGYRREDYHEGILISDTPYDYMTMYANARRVYTDLVHATIISLMYGTPVRYWRTDKRFQAFYALNELTEKEGWLSVDEKSLQKQKRDVERQIISILQL